MTRFNRTVIPRSEATWESPKVFRRVSYDSLQRNSEGIATPVCALVRNDSSIKILLDLSGGRFDRMNWLRHELLSHELTSS